MKISIKKLVRTLSVLILSPVALVHGHVFYCPPGDKISLEQTNHKRLWAGDMHQLPAGVPEFFKTLRYTAESLVEDMGPRDDVTDPKPDQNLTFLRAYYKAEESFRYGCVYADKDDSEIEVELTFSDAKIPETELPLLVQTYGPEWEKQKDGTCKNRGLCGFFVPEISIRYELISKVVLGENEAGINLMGLYDSKGEPRNVTLSAKPGRHYKFESNAVFQQPGVTRLLVNYPGDGEMEMFSFLRANGLQKNSRPDCNLQLEEVAVCDCTDKNIQALRVAHAHMILDVYQAVDESKATQTLRCDLYHIPFKGKYHTPSNHEAHKEL